MRPFATAGSLAVLGLVMGIVSPLPGADDDVLRPLGMGGLSRLSKARTRSISPENFTGEKGKGGMATEGTGANVARDLGRGWKISPSVKIAPGQTFTMGEIQGEGVIQHIWMTPTGPWRQFIFRIYWDGEATPSVESPVGDFFASGWGGYAQISSLAVCVNPGSAFNSYWEMPFRKGFKITMENRGLTEQTLYYQIDYALGPVPEDAAYFHAQFRRVNPLPYKQVYTILDGVKGWGPLRRHLHRLGRPQQRLVGRRRDQVLPRRRRRVPDHRRHRDRGLFQRLVQLREPGHPPVPGVHDSVFGPRAGPAAGRTVQVAAAVLSLPLARHGSGALREGPARDHPGPGLDGGAIGKRLALPAPAGRHRFRRLLVPARAARAVPGPARPRPAGRELASGESGATLCDHRRHDDADHGPDPENDLPRRG